MLDTCGLARPNEAALYRKAADASQSPDDLLLIYLVELDVVAEEQAVEPELFHRCGANCLCYPISNPSRAGAVKRGQSQSVRLATCLERAHYSRIDFTEWPYQNQTLTRFHE